MLSVIVLLIASVDACDVVEFRPQYGSSIPAINKWTDDYMNNTLGNKTFDVELRIDKLFDTIDPLYRMNFSTYLQLTDKYYFAEILSTDMGELYEDLDLVDDRLIVDEFVWIGDHISGYHIHVDVGNPRDVLYCQIRGRKHWNVYDYSKYDKDMHSPFSENLNRAKTLPDNVVIGEYMLEAGDCLCIPPWWMHSAQGFDNSIGVVKVFPSKNMPFIFDYEVRRVLKTIYNMIKNIL